MEKGVRIGDRVKVSGRLGLVYEVLDKLVHIKFDDGSHSNVSYDSVEPYLVPSTWKNYCPFCKNAAIEVRQDRAYGGESVYQCEKCEKRFSL